MTTAKKALTAFDDYRDMLADTARMDAFTAAIRDAVSPGDVVVDLKELFSFADRTVELSASLPQPQDWLFLSHIIQDGIAQGRNGRLRADIRVVGDLNGLEIRGPRRGLITAVGNLVRNALQAQASGVGSVEVSLARPEPNTGKPWQLLVDDDGPGVPEERWVRIFDDGQSYRAGGSGYGLAQVKQVVEGALGGRVGCTESPLGGARFSVEIPAALVREAAAAPAKEVTT